jgi:universal stress protein A
MKTNVPSDPPADASPLSEQGLKTSSGSGLASYRRFLLTIDFSEHSKKTTEHAIQLATFTGAGIIVCHVFQIPDYPAAFYQGLYTEHELVKSHVEMAKREANTQLAAVTEQITAIGLKAESILRVGNPFEEIVNAARELGVDLIVIGSHGYRGLERLLLGSTAERVVQYAKCPVLVVKDAARHV